MTASSLAAVLALVWPPWWGILLAVVASVTIDRGLSLGFTDRVRDVVLKSVEVADAYQDVRWAIGQLREQHGTDVPIVLVGHSMGGRAVLRAGGHDGVAAVVEKLKGNPLFGHVTLTRSERSPIAALVTDMLEDIGI